MSERADLYRAEAINASHENWLGAPTMLAPPGANFYATISLLVIVLAALTLGFGSYARKLQVVGSVVHIDEPVRIYSPVDGQSVAVKFSDGAPVRRGDLLLEIASGAPSDAAPVDSEQSDVDRFNFGSKTIGPVPTSTATEQFGRYEVEFSTNEREVSALAPGMEILMSFDAFPHRRFGQFTGAITIINRNPAPTDTAGNSVDRPYRVRATLDQGSLRYDGGFLPLLPGTTAVGQIEIEKRPIYEWLLFPLFRHTGARDG